MISQFLLGFFLAFVPESKCSWLTTPILIGHRGAKARAPENTIESFRLALELGANGVEFDVYLSADKIPFVFHDDTLERTTNGSGVAFKKNFHDLQDLDASKGWSNFAGAKIPSLRETLEKMPDSTYVNIELKGQGIHKKTEFVDIILEVMKPHRERLFIVVSSFDAVLLKILRRRDEQIRIGFLLSDQLVGVLPSLFLLKSIRPNALHLPPGAVSRNVVDLAHRKGVRVMVWTVNESSQKDALLNLSVDGIFSDLPRGFTWQDSKL